jgi:predicted MPP superfamily phosphohydrolase
LKAKTFFVTGNHESYLGIDNVEKVLSSTNVDFLEDRMAEYKGLQIIGMNFGESFNGPDLSKVKFDSSKPSVLLYHSPSGVEESSKAGISLQLSGHTHAGQIDPFNLILKLFYPAISGLHKFGNMYLYISPGTGTWGPPIRVGSLNEITVLNLIPK